MKKRSILWCVFHHPLKIITRTVVIWIVLMLVWYFLSDDGEALMQSDYIIWALLSWLYSLVSCVYRRYPITN